MLLTLICKAGPGYRKFRRFIWQTCRKFASVDNQLGLAITGKVLVSAQAVFGIIGRTRILMSWAYLTPWETIVCAAPGCESANRVVADCYSRNAPSLSWCRTDTGRCLFFSGGQVGPIFREPRASSACVGDDGLSCLTKQPKHSASAKNRVCTDTRYRTTYPETPNVPKYVLFLQSFSAVLL